MLVLLHWLGGGAQTWGEVARGLAGRGMGCVALDLPGFGEAADEPATDVTTAVDRVIETIRGLRADAPEAPWLLGGHSMGGKIAAVVARRAVDGEPGLEGLRGLVLVSPSPPSPEPVAESRRAEHLRTFGEATPAATRRGAAAAWVDKNTGILPLAGEVRERAIAGVLAIPPESFRAWFLAGSKEDWSERVGVLPLPALVLSGTEETSLGEETQRKHTLPHLPQARLVSLQATAHLAPLERPGEVVEFVTEFATGLGLELRTEVQGSGEAFKRLVDSMRTSPQTRKVLEDRLARSLTWNYRAKAFSGAEFRTLRALAQAVVPDAGFDLAACLDAQLAENQGDGWRHAALPPDPAAWRHGLLSLNVAARVAHGVDFVALFPDQQHALLMQAAEGKLVRRSLGELLVTEASGAFDADAMKQWFEDVRAEFTRLYMADPRTMERIGYTGFADDLGFTQIKLGQQEEFAR